MPLAKRATTRRSPAKKRSAKKTTTKRTAAKKTVPKRGPRKMSASHKQALADGRAASAAVDRYLQALHEPKRRGRKVSPDTLKARLAAAEDKARSASGLARLQATQDVRDLRAKLAAAGRSTETDIKSLESEFVRVAREYGSRKGIGYGAWRDAGVPAPVLKRARIARTRGR
jgi:hypothetical protein